MKKMSHGFEPANAVSLKDKKNVRYCGRFLRHCAPERSEAISLIIAFLFLAFFSCFCSAQTFEKIEMNMEEKLDSEFYVSKISDELFQKIKGKSFKSDCTIPLDDLRYVHVLHWNFQNQETEGELVCNKKIAEKLILIFRELYKSKYQIEKIRLIDEYDADDELSMRDNNSSCFNFRFISHTKKVSMHGAGLAVDINPLYNPYTKKVGGKQIVEPLTGTFYVDRTQNFPHKIDHSDLCYKLFTAQGFEWGGDWTGVKDWQHFEFN